MPGQPNSRDAVSANRQLSKRLTLLVLFLVLLTAAGIAYFSEQSAPVTALPDTRIPVTNPPVEPDRPDLFSEPRIEDSPEQDE